MRQDCATFLLGLNLVPRDQPRGQEEATKHGNDHDYLVKVEKTLQLAPIPYYLIHISFPKSQHSHAYPINMSFVPTEDQTLLRNGPPPVVSLPLLAL